MMTELQDVRHGAALHAKMRIAGEQVGGARTIEVLNPWNGKVVGTVPKATVEDIRRAFAVAKSYKPTLAGYAGPCPNAEHTYVWTIYAIDVDTLPDTSETTTKEEIATLAKAHDLASAKLSAKYAP